MSTEVRPLGSIPSRLEVEPPQPHSPHRMWLVASRRPVGWDRDVQWRVYWIQEQKTGARRGYSPVWTGFHDGDAATMREIARRFNAYPKLIDLVQDFASQGNRACAELLTALGETS